MKCEVCEGYPSASSSFWSVDLVRNDATWKRWTCCSKECAEAFAVTNVVKHGQRLDEDGFSYKIWRRD